MLPKIKVKNLISKHAELEKKLSEFAGSRYCLSCLSGTDALLIALMARNI